MQKIIVCLGIAACFLLSSCKNQQMLPSGETPDYHLFLLAGQSNMAGRGVVAETDKEIHPSIVALNKDGAWAPAIDPIHFDKPIAGVGPGRSFAIAVSEANPDITIGLIPTAVGGSPISSWEPGAYYEATNTHPYDDALARTQTALQSGSLKAILWHQGESDSNEQSAPEYKDKLIALIERFRTEFDDPTLPFLIGQLGNFSERPWNEWRHMVDQAHQEVADEIDGVYFIQSTGLTHKGDSVHFSADAMRTFGERYAQTYIEHARTTK